MPAPLQSVCRDCLAFSRVVQTRCVQCGSARCVSHDELGALTIAHIDCDAFFAAIEKRDNPALRDRPVIVGHAGGRGVVTTACYIARRYGPRSAMPMFRALELCPEAVVIAPNMAKYREAGQQIRAIFRAATPRIEPVSLDEAYLDLSADERTDRRPPPVILAGIAQRVEREVGITVSIGLSANKFLAKLASDLDKPRGFSVIGQAEAADFLAPLPVRKIAGVGAATAGRMETRGITTIGQLQELSEQQLVADYGKFGRRLAHYCRGEDSRRVTPFRRAKSVSAETTFAVNKQTPEDLCAALWPLCERVAARLQKADLAGVTVVLKLKTADFRLLTRHYRLANPTRRAKVIFKAASLLVERAARGAAFRLIGVGLAELSPGRAADPPDLFGR